MGCFVHALYACGLEPLASVSAVYYFSLKVLEGPIWGFLCIDVFPLFSPVTWRI